jgi:hypothetical protein
MHNCPTYASPVPRNTAGECIDKHILKSHPVETLPPTSAAYEYVNFIRTYEETRAGFSQLVTTRQDKWLKNLHSRWSREKKRRNIKVEETFEEIIGGTKRAITHISMVLHNNYDRDGYSWLNYGSNWACDHDEAFAKMDDTSLETIKLTTHYSNYVPLFHHDNLEKGTRQRRIL